jgi:hypothetical protein
MALVCGACNATRRTLPSVEGPLYSEQEIRSRTWIDPHGHPVEIAEWLVVKSSKGDELLIASYKERDTGLVTSLDFYRVERDKATYGSVVDVSSVGSFGGPRTTYQRVPPHTRFVLLRHDNRSAVVKSVETKKADDGLAVEVVVESYPGLLPVAKAARYRLDFAHGVVVETADEGWWTPTTKESATDGGPR